MVFVNDRSTKPWKTINEEENIILIQVERNLPELGSDTFELDIKDKKIIFWGTRRTKLVNESKKLEVIWEIPYIGIPPKLQKETAKIRKIIEEAMQVFGTLHSTENVTSTTIKFL
jgi:hypothetical protein